MFSWPRNRSFSMSSATCWISSSSSGPDSSGGVAASPSFTFQVEDYGQPLTAGWISALTLSATVPLERHGVEGEVDSSGARWDRSSLLQVLRIRAEDQCSRLIRDRYREDDVLDVFDGVVQDSDLKWFTRKHVRAMTHSRMLDVHTRDSDASGTEISHFIELPRYVLGSSQADQMIVVEADCLGCIGNADHAPALD